MRGIVVVCRDRLRDEVVGISRTAGAIAVSSAICARLHSGHDINIVGKAPKNFRRFGQIHA